jgi:hypothetical protein
MGRNSSNKKEKFSPIGCNPLLYKPLNFCKICGGSDHIHRKCPLIIENFTNIKKCEKCGSYLCSNNPCINNKSIKNAVALTPITYYNNKLFIMIHQRKHVDHCSLALGSIGGSINEFPTPVEAVKGESKEEAQLELDNNSFAILNTTGISNQLLSYFTILHIQNTAKPDSGHINEVTMNGPSIVIEKIKKIYSTKATDHYFCLSDKTPLYYIWISIESYLEIAKPIRDNDGKIINILQPNGKYRNPNELNYSPFYNIIKNINRKKFIDHLKNLEWLNPK